MLPFYEYSTSQFQIFSGKEMDFPPHIHAATEIIYVRAGEILVQHGEKNHRVRQGELMLFFPNEVHAYSAAAPDTYFSMYIYRSRLCEELDKVFATKLPNKFILKAQEIPGEALRILDTLSSAQENGDSPLIIRLYFSLLWARLFPLLELTQRTEPLEEDLLIAVLSYISANYTEPISLENLAKKFGVSRYKISRLFTHSIRVGLNDYVNTMRVNQAKNLLQNPDASIISVAFSCGFESQQTFNRVFKEICGTTPKEFRNEIFI